MGHFRKARSPLAACGTVALILGSGVLAWAVPQILGSPAFADSSHAKAAITTTAAPLATSTSQVSSTTVSSTTTTTTLPTTPTSQSSTTTTASSVRITGPYELYCIFPLKNVVLNDVTTSATTTPTNPTIGEQFNVTYQTFINIPQSFLTPTQPLQPQLEGTATFQVDASGAMPGTTSVGAFDFDVTIPSPVPSDGIDLSLPTSPETVGPFTATSSHITIRQDTNTTLTVDAGPGSASPLTLACSSYPNDTNPTSGSTSATPSGPTIYPIIAVVGGGGTPIGPGTETTSPTSNSAPAGIASVGIGSGTVVAGPSALAFTGTSAATKWIMLVGTVFVMLGGGLLILVDAPRRTLPRLRRRRD